MIADILLLITAFIALIFAAIADIKTTEIPNWLTYNLIISALAIRLITSIATNQYYYITYALIAFAITLIIANILYKLQIWGGGDSKLLIGLSTVFATKPYFLNMDNLFFQSMPFVLILITCILIAGAVYSMVFAVVLAVMHRKKFFLEIKNLYGKIRFIRILTLIVSIIFFIITFLIPLVLKPIFLITAVLILIYPYIWLGIKSVENSAMYKTILADKLREGDWITQDIINKTTNKIIYKKTRTGIEKHQIKKLIENNIHKVTIKTGIPFVPSFLLGLILTIIICLV